MSFFFLTWKLAIWAMFVEVSIKGRRFEDFLHASFGEVRRYKIFWHLSQIVHVLLAVSKFRIYSGIKYFFSLWKTRCNSNNKNSSKNVLKRYITYMCLRRNTFLTVLWLMLLCICCGSSARVVLNGGLDYKHKGHVLHISILYFYFMISRNILNCLNNFEKSMWKEDNFYSE